MNKILEQVDHYIHEELKNKLPEVGMADLEDNGAVFYMNGKNGTACDWYVNGHFPYFFIFYSDKENLGAVKAALYADGGLIIYVYGDKGHADPKEISCQIDADDDELLNLAVLLTENADNKMIWDEDIAKLASEGTASAQSVDAFLGLKEYFEPMIEIRKMYGKTAIVSKKVREGGWKISYGVRDEPTRETDSGWFFSAGDESDDYINDVSNLELWAVASVLTYDQALNEFITAPYGTSIVRVDHDKFEIDAPGKEILIEKRRT